MDECSLYGVTWGSTGEIIELDLSHNNLEWDIPQEICKYFCKNQYPFYFVKYVRIVLKNCQRL